MDYRLGNAETKFADIIWEREPISSSELVKICGEEFGWKKSTTYTVLKRLCEKGFFKNENGTVASLISQQEFRSTESKLFVESTFDGSLPAFFAAFMGGGKISEKEVKEIQQMIDEYSRNNR